MIPEQLSLFGGPPKPPARIKVDETQEIVESTGVNIQEAVPEEDTIASDGDQPDMLAEQAEESNNFQEPGAMEDTIVIMPEDLAQPVSLVATEGQEELGAETQADEFHAIEQEPELENIVEGELSAVEQPAKESAVAMMDNQPGDNATEHSNAEENIVIENQVTASMSASNLYEQPEQLNIPPDEELFKRQYYSMRETAAMFEVSHSLLRFWENEFDVLQPRKNKKGDRYFRPVDIKNLQLIYHLLRVRKFTIEGAKEFLRNRNKALDTFGMIQRLEKLKGFLFELKAHL